MCCRYVCMYVLMTFRNNKIPMKCLSSATLRWTKTITDIAQELATKKTKAVCV